MHTCALPLCEQWLHATKVAPVHMNFAVNFMSFSSLSEHVSTLCSILASTTQVGKRQYSGDTSQADWVVSALFLCGSMASCGAWLNGRGGNRRAGGPCRDGRFSGGGCGSGSIGGCSGSSGGSSGGSASHRSGRKRR